MSSVLANSLGRQSVLVCQARQGAAFQPLRLVQGSCAAARRGQSWPGRRQGNSSSAGQRTSKFKSSPLRALNEGNSSKDPSLEDYVEVRIESVRVSQGASIVYLRVVGSESVIPVHIGENESNALLREINKQRQVRGSGRGLGRLVLCMSAHGRCCAHIYPAVRWTMQAQTAQ